MSFRQALTLVLATLLYLPAAADGLSRVEIVEAFRAARKAGDLETARGFLTDDPRVWYDAKEGDGSPWKLGAGRWKTWDTYFNGASTPDGPWRETGDTVWVDMTETNDFFRLTERRDPPRYRVTYFLEDDRIAGYMISGAPGKKTPKLSRREEFEAWAREHAPEEAEYLMPGGSIDPTGDRAPRMKALLLRWREAAGLPPLDAD
jgi:hypothetical protein